MRRRSVVGPILLILIGILFLTRNLWQQIPLFDLLAHYWPFILIGWGLLRLIEVAVLAMSDKPLTNRLSGGEILLIILLCLIGSGMMAASNHGIHLPPLSASGVEIFGQQYDYDQTAQKPALAAVHVVLDNLRGNVRVTGSDDPQVKVEQHKTVRAMQRSEADQADRETPLEIVSDGSDRLIIRTNQDRVSTRRRIAADLEVTVPRGASIEARSTYGDFDITDVAGTVDINSANAGVRLNKIGGNVKIDLGRSDIIRAVDVKGAMDVQGKGSDIDLEDMGGQVTINGSYSGTLQFKNLAKPLHFESRQTDLRVAQLPGSITMDLGDFTANNLVGPIRLVTRSRDIRMEDFTQSLELESERGDIELRPGKTPLPKIDVRARNGRVDLILPESAQFDLRLSTNRGEAQNEFGPAIKTEIDGQASTLKGSVGKGPTINITTERGTVSVKKG